MARRVLGLVLLAAGASLTCADGFLPFDPDAGQIPHPPTTPDMGVFGEFLDALQVMQDQYFAPWLGTWPTSIDWTAAVMGTHVSGALTSLSKGLGMPGAAGFDEYKAKENLITTYFSQVLSFYFGQDAFTIRSEAFDDILWVVLGWLEAVQFIDSYSELYSSAVPGLPLDPAQHVSDVLLNQTWYGKQWTAAFAHRSRIFWYLAEQGWDTKLCGGGMNWNPHFEPYKNAITNELYVAGSVAMYLYFPGDANTSPYSNPKDPRVKAPPGANGPFVPHDPKYLEAAMAGYSWLASVGMQGPDGLYVDGFHIPDWNNATNPNTKCTARDDMLYTYNQGVLLSGQRGLWEVTRDAKFLYDGHSLIQAAINATGYHLRYDRPVDNITGLEPGDLPPWHGLGRAGVLEDQCDAAGTCSQDSQTFKGIYFHHLTTFCAPLSGPLPGIPGAAGKNGADFAGLQDAHSSACAAYVGWIRHNALAALATRDSAGKFGMWWTAGILNLAAGIKNASMPYNSSASDENSVDYRTYGVPQDALWVTPSAHTRAQAQDLAKVLDQIPLGHGGMKRMFMSDAPVHLYRRADTVDASDPNTRGRGRTVETQGGGLAVLRALWEISSSPRA